MLNVIIPAYNCSKTLGRTLASLVAQTDQNFEVILIDDCSIEDITSIVEDYSKKININYIRHEKNMGCGMSRQTGIDNATASHLMFLDADDILMPYTIENFNAFLKVDPQVELLHSPFYEQGMSVEGIPIYMLRKNGFDWCHGKLYSVEAIKRFGIRNVPSIKWADDSYFNSICCELFSIKVIQVPTYIWTNTRTSAMRKVDASRDKLHTRDMLQAMIMSCEFVSKYKKHIKHLPGTIKRWENEVEANSEEAELLEKLRSYQTE